MIKLEEVRIRETMRVLNFYNDDFTEYLATTISFTETLPEEINNQIRDAFTHLSRVQQATSQKSIIEEARLSVSHIERANRDCLKASIIKARAELDELISDAIFFHGFLTPNLKAAFKDLVETRRSAYRLETKGDNGQIEKLEEILRMTMDLSDKIMDHYGVAGKKKTRFLRWVMRWFRPMAFVLTLIVGTAIGFLLKSIIEKYLPNLF